MAFANAGLAPSLSANVLSLRAELDQIEQVFYASRGLNRVTEYKVPYAPAEDGCLVALWDAWNRFVRGLLLQSCAGIAEGLSGTIHAPTTPMTELVALGHIQANRRGTNIILVRGEPKWFDPGAIADLTDVLAIANRNEIVSSITASRITLGLATIPNPIEEIRICRNFIAHKGDMTLGDVQRFSGAFTDLRTHMRSKRYGVELFSDWKEGCLAIAEAAAQ
jgi:hypothetical protein